MTVPVEKETELKKGAAAVAQVMTDRVLSNSFFVRAFKKAATPEQHAAFREINNAIFDTKLEIRSQIEESVPASRLCDLMINKSELLVSVVSAQGKKARAQLEESFLYASMTSEYAHLEFAGTYEKSGAKTLASIAANRPEF